MSSYINVLLISLVLNFGIICSLGVSVVFLQIGTGEIQISVMPTLLKYANKWSHPSSPGDTGAPCDTHYPSQ